MTRIGPTMTCRLRIAHRAPPVVGVRLVRDNPKSP
jgi:hypothetical protein